MLPVYRKMHEHPLMWSLDRWDAKFSALAERQ